MAINTRIVNGSHTEIYVGGGNFITQAAPTNFHSFWSSKILAADESADLFVEVTAARRAQLEQSDAAWVRPPQCFIDQWNAAVGEYGCYNEATGFFELNGITDIPYAEAMEIYLHRATNRSSLSFQWGEKYKARTTIGIPCDSIRQNVALDQVMTMNKYIQVLRLAQPDRDEIPTRSVTQFVSGAPVRRIVPIITDNGVPKTSIASYHWNAAFNNCYHLEYVKIRCLGSSLSLKGCPKFDMDCLKYIVDNAIGSDITITLHPDAYARVTDDIFAAAAAKNITIATP